MTRKHFRKAVDRIAASCGDAVDRPWGERLWVERVDQALRTGETPEAFHKRIQTEENKNNDTSNP